VVDDGSTDDSAEIAARHGCWLISTENRGLASARNTGMRAAGGEIVAYLDDDAHPDPHWLRYLVATIEDGGFAGAGGPNLPPGEDCPVARCVAEAPGGPIHVLLSDREAEHLPGCNMAFRRAALERLDGFDPQFHVAGDDVDICWRLLEAGQRLGYSPAAVVWHSRRPSVRAYLRQQRGYGAAEALLERKWPHRYGPAGRARWRGRLYGRGLVSGIGRGRVYYGTWGSEPFQALYGAQHGPLAALGSFPEWHLVLVGLAAASIAAVWWAPLLAALPLLAAALIAWAAPGALCAARATFMHEQIPRRRKLKMWALTTFLHLAQPLARLRGRMRTPPWRPVKAPRAAIPWSRTAALWSEGWRAAEDRLAEVERAARADGAPVFCGSTWDRWDLHLRAGLLGGARLRMGLEEHGGGRQLVRTRITPHVPAAALGIGMSLVVVTVAAVLAHAWAAAAVMGIVSAALGAAVLWECGVATAWLDRHTERPPA
jgi:O-antigen biosynthesis protein